MKKAIELSVLCDCEVAIMVFHENQLHQYSSQDVIDNTLRRYNYYDGPYECIRSTDVRYFRRWFSFVSFIFASSWTI